MNIEDIIRRILWAKPELTREDVLKMIELKERSARGFLTRESAALSLAVELGVTVEKASFRRELQIKDLVSGLNDVTIAGRVINVSPMKKFIRQNGREGAKRSIFIADVTGIVKVTLWDEKALCLEPEIMLDRLVRLRHASVRRRAGGKLELNVGSKSELEIEPENLKEENYPSLASFTKTVGEITGNERKVDVIGLVKQVYPTVTFKRQDGGEGKVKRVLIKNHTGEITLILWDNDAEAVSENHIGRYVMISDAGVKRRFDGRIELHRGDQTTIMFLTKKPSGFVMKDDGFTQQ